MTSLENFEVGKLVQDMIDHARFCPHSVERETERKTGWRWGIVWYSVSLVHPGRYDFRKSKTIYQYPLNPISSFRPRSCKEKMWRAMHDRFMPQIYSCITPIYHTQRFLLYRLSLSGFLLLTVKVCISVFRACLTECWEVFILYFLAHLCVRRE